MPRFNQQGQVTPQIGYSWYDQSRYIFQDCSSGVCRVTLSDGTTIAETGVVRLLGNGHRVWAYVEFTPGIDPTQAVYRDSFGQALTNAYPQAISPDGAICVKPHSNIGATVLEADGRSWPLSDGDAQDIQLLSGGRAIWAEGGIVHSNFPIVGNPGVPVWWPRVAADGTLLYQRQRDGALVLGGKVIAPPSDKYFGPDVLLLGDVYHVTWSPSQADTNAQFMKITRGQLAELPEEEPALPPPPPPPPPPPRMFTPIRLPDAAQEIVNALYIRHRALAHGDDDQRRELTKKIAEQVRFALGPAWGWKRAGGPPSKDSIAKQEENALHGFDLFNGATREPNDHPMSVDITGQTFIEVEPVNHLGEPPPPPPPPPPPLFDELRKLQAELQIVREAIANQQVELAGLRIQVAAQADELLRLRQPKRFKVQGQSGKAWGHSHSFTVEVESA